MSQHALSPILAVLLGLPLLAACSDDGSDPLGTVGFESVSSECTIPSSKIYQGGPGKDGIPALTDPSVVGIQDPGADYLLDDDRVIALELNGRAIAVPLNIGWWHEIVNLSVDGHPVSVTHCPLTGSSLVFDRRSLDDVAFGVSGLLYQSNLIMYDRTTGESLWPQMLREARCGPGTGTKLAMVPAIEMRWDAFRTLHPEGRVLSDSQGFSSRNYRSYPYGSYAHPDNPTLLFPLGSSIDARRPPKERVLGIPMGTGGIAFPFGALDKFGSTAVVDAGLAGSAVVVFWNGEAQAAMAYRPSLDGEPLTFRATPDGILDDETGSVWRITGEAVAGPLTGRRLTPVAEAYVAYWFAWAAFHPEASLWTG